MAWADRLLPASWRGLNFAVDANAVAAGRRLAVHEYPYRDEVWPEDLGKAPRRHSIQGFIVGDDVADRRREWLAAAEQAGAGTLVHPSLGVLELTLLTFSCAERKDLGRVVELQLEFIAGGQALFPIFALATGAGVAQAATAALAGLATSFAKVTAPALEFGAAVVAEMQGTLQEFGVLAVAATRDAGQVAGIAAGLAENLGRYGAGKRATAALPTDTLATLLAANTEAQAAVVAAAAALPAAAGQDAAADVPTASLALVDAVRAVATDPAQQLRVAAAIAAFAPRLPTVTTRLGNARLAGASAAASLGRRHAALSMARIGADYRPGSYDEAMALRDQILAVLDAEITAAGDAGEDDAYLALRALRTAVAEDLDQRAAQLARLRLFTAAAPLPALTLAQSLYRDGTRADDLVRRVDPRHPAFMPTQFRALAA